MSGEITWTRTVWVPFNAGVTSKNGAALAATSNAARSGAFMATGSMLCVQIGLAASIGLFDAQKFVEHQFKAEETYEFYLAIRKKAAELAAKNGAAKKKVKA